MGSGSLYQASPFHLLIASPTLSIVILLLMVHCIALAVPFPMLDGFIRVMVQNPKA